MAIKFKSLRSSSKGNSLLLCSDTTKILIDCGLGSMKKTRQIVSEAADDISSIDAVLVSHMHSDHISHYPLRVIEDHGLDIYAFEDSFGQMMGRHSNNREFASLRFQGFNESGFEIGDFVVEPFSVPHQPDFPTFGFVLRCRQGRAWKKIVVATDFSDSAGLLDYFKDADLVFLESNHDLELLRLNFNYNSRFHLSNPNASAFLYEMQEACELKGRRVMLGHMSTQRNTAELAVGEVENFFAANGASVKFELTAAPAYSQSDTIELS
jgi:phosphoribosyl 1,2-cyclic phosphodiesterase